MSQTVLQSIVDSMRGVAVYNRNDQVGPSVILWPDQDRQWEPVIRRLREQLPVLTLGPYDPAHRTGPAIWIRCMIARTLPAADWPEADLPILYLPGYSRADLRAVEECKKDVQPLVELQFLGVFWTQKNGKDWTVAAFIQSEDGGLGLDLAKDAPTQAALLRALPDLLDEEVDALRQEGLLRAETFDEMVAGETSHNLLQWLNAPAQQRARWSAAAWEAFCSLCKRAYGFNPQSEVPEAGAERLGVRAGEWAHVWARFAEAPHRYPNLPELLRKARPFGFVQAHPSSWPQDNQALERDVHETLTSLAKMPEVNARQAIFELEAAHSKRRSWVWAELGQSPLAFALQHMAALAQICQHRLVGASPAEMAEAYANGGWKADAAVLDALSAVGAHQHLVEAVKAGIRAVYRPWLEESAERLQQLLKEQPLPCTGPELGAAGSSCILFADGLRYDIGQRLAAELANGGLLVDLTWRSSALPGVTATAKPAVSPVAGLLTAGPEFMTLVEAKGSKLTIESFRGLLETAGYNVLQGDDTGPVGSKGWTESGNLDSYGHAQQWRLALRVDEEVRNLQSRIHSLLAAGWEEVVVVTDHGWLLLPGGLPKADLPEHLTEARKGRCARLKPMAASSYQTMPWYWDSDVEIAIAPGVCTFVHGKEYEHGGVSVQECVVPVVRVRPGTAGRSPAEVRSVKWTRLRCRVEVEGAQPGWTVDLRTKPLDPATTLSGAKPVDAQGIASLLVEDGDRAGEAAVLVLLNGSEIVAKHVTTVGG